MAVVKNIYPVLGMSCAACAAHVDKALRAVEGVSDVAVNLASNSVMVSRDADVCDAAALKAAVVAAGYDLVTDEGEERQRKADEAAEMNYRQLKTQTIMAFALAVPVMVLGMGFPHVRLLQFVVWILASVILFVFGRRFFMNAFRLLRHKTVNMDTLVAGSTGIAWLFSTFNLLFPQFWLSRGIEPHLYFDAASGIIAFILLGRLLEARAKNRTGDSVKALMGLQPKVLTLLAAEGEKQVPISSARISDIVLVRPGERVPLDGIVADGRSWIDESMLTGESVPVEKLPGDSVFAGTMNGRGSFSFKVTKTGGDTVLSRIIAMVRDAQGSKAPVQSLVDKVAAVFVPVIMVISLAAFLCWVIFAPENGFTYGLLAMVTVLIIACPCALGLATPTAITVGIGKGAESGILIKDAASLETAGKVDAVVLDKTGTLTAGHPAVVGSAWREDATDGSKARLRAIESLSAHPIAEAVAESIPFTAESKPQDFENISGRGVKAVADGIECLAGNREFMEENGVERDAALEAQAARWTDMAYTVIRYAEGGRQMAVYAVSDPLKPSSAKAVRMLAESGIEVHMLTGDNEAAAAAIAGQAGIQRWKAGVLPADKADYVKRLQTEGKVVAMVGDGINDSAALALADVSIAMGKGSDVAMDTAMVTILSSDLMKIPAMIKLSRLTVRTIRQNLFWAFFYNLLAVPVAAGALYPVWHFLINPMIGGIAMAFSSVTVVSNSLRLRRKKIEDDNKPNIKTMKKTYKVEGMMCDHCRAHVENALNSIEGVKASVTLKPGEAEVEFSGKEYTLGELQKVVSEKAGDYRLS